MVTPFNKAITVATGEDVAALKQKIKQLEAKNNELENKVNCLQSQLEHRDLGFDQYIKMHCNQITDTLIIKKYADLAVTGKNVVVRANAISKVCELVTAFINNYGVEEYADIYHGKINDMDIHSFPYKHSKLDVVSGLFGSGKFSMPNCSEAFGQWVVDRPWK